MASLVFAGAALGMAVMGGVYFTFSAFVMRALGGLPTEAGVTAMQAINAVILKSLFMPLFFGTSLFALAAAVWAALDWGAPGSLSLLVAGLVYFLGMFVCTAAGNVPLNDMLAGLAPSDATGPWHDYLRQWMRLNHLRTVASMTSAALLLHVALLRLPP